jgi:hypothetical protein
MIVNKPLRYSSVRLVVKRIPQKAESDNPHQDFTIPKPRPPIFTRILMKGLIQPQMKHERELYFEPPRRTCMENDVPMPPWIAKKGHQNVECVREAPKYGPIDCKGYHGLYRSPQKVSRSSTDSGSEGAVTGEISHVNPSY